MEDNIIPITKVDEINNLGHLMIDLETMGTKTLTSPIVSIGAVEFNLETGETGRTFYRLIDLQSVFDLGIMPQANTIKWWMSQDVAARQKIIEGKGMNISQAIYEFGLFIRELKPKNLQVWGNSNRFDLGALEIVYNKLNKEIPWKYSLERDVRTLVSLAPYIKANTEFVGIKHDPIDDCKHQIKYCSETYNFLCKIKNIFENDITQKTKETQEKIRQIFVNLQKSF